MYYTIAYKKFRNFFNIKNIENYAAIEAAYARPSPFVDSPVALLQKISRAFYFKTHINGYVPIDTTISKTNIGKCLGITDANVIAYLFMCSMQERDVVLKSEYPLESVRQLADKVMPSYKNHYFEEKSDVEAKYEGTFSWEIDESFITGSWESEEYVLKKLDKDFSNILLVPPHIFHAMFSSIQEKFAKIIDGPYGPFAPIAKLFKGSSAAISGKFFTGDSAYDFFLSHPNIAMNIYKDKSHYLVGKDISLDIETLSKAVEFILNDAESFKKLDKIILNHYKHLIRRDTLVKLDFCTALISDQNHTEVLNLYLEKCSTFEELQPVMKRIFVDNIYSSLLYTFLQGLTESQFMQLYNENYRLIGNYRGKKLNFSEDFFKEIINGNRLGLRFFHEICPEDMKVKLVGAYFEKTDFDLRDQFCYENIDVLFKNEDYLLKALSKESNIGYIPTELLKNVDYLKLLNPNQSNIPWEVKEIYQKLSDAEALVVVGANIENYSFVINPVVRHDHDFAFEYLKIKKVASSLPRELFLNYDFCQKILPLCLEQPNLLAVIALPLWNNEHFAKDFFQYLDTSPNPQHIIQHLPEKVRTFLQKADIESGFYDFFTMYLEKKNLQTQLTSGSRTKTHKI